MNKKRFEIEPRIKALVDILNEVPYIRTNSSCEGHYGDEDYQKHKANVAFDVEKEREAEFENLATLILAETADLVGENIKVSIHKRYWVMPQDTELRWVWEIEICPIYFWYDEPAENEKREITDRAISITASAVKKYLSVGK